jgi:hypothetical protein
VDEVALALGFGEKPDVGYSGERCLKGERFAVFAKFVHATDHDAAGLDA